ncbi:S1/P1 nuclease [Lysobacter sp. BMK333-48F3]|uniref:S1/P1 nuclease n=1 Tax=Lysobacter sp. BMK333-48F3 TaxID=2867962 RepID=UPI001C8C7B67|nr:S1/P1 nuclease [Lysobacter sp. BMK333-48F3]MBX9401864.1 S1/P1 nuclease [Lysobacter sp. BMK333-48F3]
MNPSLRLASSSLAARVLRPLACAALLLTVPAQSLAWGPQGHRLVAALAWDRLSPQARAEARKLLAGEADPTLPGIANWADELRANDPKLGKLSAKWHYVNLAERGAGNDCAYQPARHCRGGDCAIEAIRNQTAILADPGRSRAERLQALKFVVHLVGDVHQPLHAGYADDKGGNDFQIHIDGEPEPADGYGTNLHSLWDSRMLTMARLDDAAYLAKLRRQPLPPIKAIGLPPAAADWARQSCRIVERPGLYPPSHTLDASYVATWRPVTEQQLRLGGARLAAVLDAALAPRR